VSAVPIAIGISENGRKAQEKAKGKERERRMLILAKIGLILAVSKPILLLTVLGKTGNSNGNS
jgi:hypothetical protein